MQAGRGDVNLLQYRHAQKILERGVRQHYVYFILAESEDRSAIKIGTSTDPHGRLAAIRGDTTKRPDWVRASPAQLRLHGWVNGDQELEKTLHLAFAKYRIVGEWFAYAPIGVAINCLLAQWCLCPGCETERMLNLAHI